MKTEDKKQKPEEGRNIVLFRDWVLKNYVNASIKGSDKEFLSGSEIVWRLRETIPTLSISDVCKVLGELHFETSVIGDMAVWVLYRIDGEQLLEEEFGMSPSPEFTD